MFVNPIYVTCHIETSSMSQDIENELVSGVLKSQRSGFKCNKNYKYISIIWEVIDKTRFRNLSSKYRKMFRKWPTKLKFNWHLIEIVETKSFFYIRNKTRVSSVFCTYIALKLYFRSALKK